MTIRDRIIDYLKNHPEGIDDGNLTISLGLKSRQQANSRCRQLEKEGFVKRVVIGGIIHNFWAENYHSTKTPTKSNLSSPNVVEQMPPTNNNPKTYQNPVIGSGKVMCNPKLSISWSLKNINIRSVADTASHQTGIDIMAEKDGKKLWVSVKGYPRGLKEQMHQPNPGIGSNTLSLISSNTAKEIKKLFWLLPSPTFHPTVIWQIRSPGLSPQPSLCIFGLKKMAAWNTDDK